jgi:hypothetical protein
MFLMNYIRFTLGMSFFSENAAYELPFEILVNYLMGDQVGVDPLPFMN